MKGIKRITGGDVIALLPAVVPLRKARKGAGQEGPTLLIAAGGFEDRALAICDDAARLDVSDVILIEYPTNQDDNESSLSELRKRIPRPTESIRYERSDFLRRFRLALRPYSDEPRLQVLVDISGMASYVVLRVLAALWSVLPRASLKIYYAEARTYHPSEKEWDSLLDRIRGASDLFTLAEEYEAANFQSRGVECVYESDIFPGKNLGALPTRALLVPNFNRERSLGMLGHISLSTACGAADQFWLIGKPPDQSRNGWRFTAMVELYGCARNSAPVSTLDYRDILRVLEDEWVKFHCDRHLVVASLGSKMQHLGLFLFLAMHQESGLILSEPSHFEAKKFSAGIGARWLVDFGQIDGLMQRIAQAGMLELIW